MELLSHLCSNLSCCHCHQRFRRDTPRLRSPSPSGELNVLFRCSSNRRYGEVTSYKQLKGRLKDGQKGKVDHENEEEEDEKEEEKGKGRKGKKWKEGEDGEMM